ncbi:MAG: RluA family pseudouridine synthase [Corallococcus sp.]|nr:RluA family pseudouridine synthase [Corallococcus sp.]
MKKQFTMDDVEILYEDNSVLVVLKPQNLPSQGDASGDVDLLTLLKRYVKEKYNKAGEAYLGLVHRLDRPTGGVMVFAKNSKSAARLSKQIAEGEMQKRYLATVLNCPKEERGQLVNYLKKNSLTNTVYVATFGTTGAKRAELNYKVLQNYHDAVSLVEVELGTGRSHQIRVQFQSIGCPVFGDARYGGDALCKGHNLALWAYKLSFEHPVTKQRMVFVAYPPQKDPWIKFDIEKYLDVYKSGDDDGNPLYTTVYRTNLN